MKIRVPILVLMLVLSLPLAALAAGPFFNSSEAGCDGSDPNVLMCEDFETADALHLTPAGSGGTGTWASENADVASANGGIDTRTKGWAMRIRDGYPHSICGSGFNVGGGSCAARSIQVNNDTNGGNAALADHNLAPSTGAGRGSSYNELYLRFYVRIAAGHNFNGQQKFITWNPCCANDGGIVFGGGPTNDWQLLTFSPFWDCGDDNYTNPQNTNGRRCYIGQNLGNSITLAGNDHWYVIEVHIKLNTYSVRNGLLEVWADDCGTTGSTCPATLTKRSNYTNIGWMGSGAGTPPSPGPSFTTTQSGQLGVIFFDIWGNPSDGGTIYIDNVKVTKIGPMGPVGGVSGTVPSAPTSLTVGPS